MTPVNPAVTELHATFVVPICTEGSGLALLLALGAEKHAHHWLRLSPLDGVQLELGALMQLHCLQAQIGFTPIKEGVPQVPGAVPSELLQALQSHSGPHRQLSQSSAYSDDLT